MRSFQGDYDGKCLKLRWGEAFALCVCYRGYLEDLREAAHDAGIPPKSRKWCDDLSKMK